MSWFKKIVSRILGDEIEETSTKYNENYNGDQQYKSFDQFENEYDDENEEETKYIDDYRQPRQGSNPNYINQRESFKFPLIPDESNRNDVPWMEDEYVQPVRNQQMEQTPYQNEQKPLHLSERRRPEQYSPFVREPRGLRGVVEKPSRENYNPFNPGGTKKITPQTKIRPSFEEKQVKKVVKDNIKTVNTESKSKKVNTDSKPKKVNTDSKPKKVNTPEEPVKKKFIPTRVPSPIYGFQTPPKRNSSIHELLEEKGQKTEKRENYITLENTAFKEVAASTQQVEKIEETVSNATNSSKMPSVEEDKTILFKLKRFQLKKVQ